MTDYSSPMLLCSKDNSDFNPVWSDLSGNIFVTVDGTNFKFVDVPPDGDCFYHSLLRCNTISDRFKDVADLRLFLKTSVLNNIGNDGILVKIFNHYRTDFLQWIGHISVMNTWATPLDMVLCCYLLNTNIISVGNYGAGLLQNNVQSSLNSILRMYCGSINMHYTIYIYFLNR